MWVKMMVPECDFTDTKYDAPVEGAGAIAQGASGRWCVVMYAGPEFISENNYTVITKEEAYTKFNTGELTGWPDF